MSDYKNFIDISEINPSALRRILDISARLKHDDKSEFHEKLLQDMQLVMIFEKASTRTRVSFEIGMNQLGGHAVNLSAADCQLGRGETVADTAQVLSRYADIIMLRTYKHSDLLEMAEYASIPVINGLTDLSHPCQIMADIMTFEEHRGNIKGKKIAWIGDYNNVANSWIQAAEKFDFTLHFACPPSITPNNLSESDHLKIFDNALDAAKNVDLVTTDTWVSMGDEDSEDKKALENFQVNEKIMGDADEDALFMHCLPAHRGEEVTKEVIDGKQSVIWDEAENRLHIQKGIMLWCLRKA
jgi:ornithine carbamoyltransferase